MIQREYMKPGRAGRCMRRVESHVCAGDGCGEVADALLCDDLDVRVVARAVFTWLSFVCGVGEGQPGYGEERYAFGGAGSCWR